MTDTEKRNKITAGVVTVAVHAAAVIMLFFLALRTPLPLPGEAGVEVDLGMYAQGMGNRQAPRPKPVAESKPEPKQEQPQEKTVTQNSEETPSLENKKKEEKKEEVKEEKPVEKEQPTVNQRALFKAPAQNAEPSSEGTTNQPGDQGKPNGLEGVQRYDGQGGSGGGPSYSLGGRGAKSLPSPAVDFKEEGKVVIYIWVDRDGIVKRAEIGKGTTTTNSTLRETALQAALNASFAEDKSATELQKGTITYTFIIRQ